MEHTLSFMLLYFCKMVTGASMGVLDKNTHVMLHLKTRVVDKILEALDKDDYIETSIANDDEDDANFKPADFDEIALIGESGASLFADGLDGYCSHVINAKVLETKKELPNHQWKFLSFKHPAPQLVKGRIDRASANFHAKWLNKVSQLELFHCYAKPDGARLMNNVEVSTTNSKSVMNGWHEFDVKSLFSTEDAANIGFLVVAYRNKRFSTPVYSITSYKPHLRINVVNKASRSARNPPQVCTNDNRDCCLQKLQINFDDEGMSFVESPKRITVYACLGPCFATRRSQLEAPSSEAKALLSFKHFLNGTRPMLGDVCCVPTGFSPFSVWIKTANPQTFRSFVLNNINATSCACQS